MEQQKESKGELIGSIIIVLVLIVGGIYFAKQIQNNSQPEASELEQVLAEDADIQAVENEEVSDEVPALESSLDEIDLTDLESIDLDSLEI